ncbi:unnamed protein product [Thelazia callipaeda]|uniref:B box-type domain-containing protein n=1 Tax=Thelazia callipaeda TaxID=103827 RepID=A0A158RB64_THECL|nr:unnamed protein product [Thelazia callipaeda]
MSCSQDSTLPDWQCEKCNLYSPQTSASLYLWCTKCEKILCALCIGKCSNESHQWVVASEIIFKLKSDMICTNAEMSKAVENMKICGEDTLRSLHGLHSTLEHLKKQCEGVTDVIRALTEALKDRQNSAHKFHMETDEHIPFTSVYVRKFQAQIKSSRNLTEEATAMIFTLNNVVKQSDDICKDARILMNSFSFESKTDSEVQSHAKMESLNESLSDKSSVNGFGDMLSAHEYNLTFGKTGTDVHQETTDVSMVSNKDFQDPEQTGILNKSDSTLADETDSSSSK